MNLRKFIPIIAECHQGQQKSGIQLGGEYLYNNIFHKNKHFLEVPSNPYYLIQLIHKNNKTKSFYPIKY